MTLYFARFRTDSKEDGIIFETVICNDLQDAHMWLDTSKEYDRVELIEHVQITPRKHYDVKCYVVETDLLLDALYQIYKQDIHRKYAGDGYCAYQEFIDHYGIDR